MNVVQPVEQETKGTDGNDHVEDLLAHKSSATSGEQPDATVSTVDPSYMDFGLFNEFLV